MYEKKLSELVSTDNRFQSSVNLQLDFGNIEKINSYIPTAASVQILGQYLHDVMPENRKHGYATALIGPYGKGKSHLILVFLGMISGTRLKEMNELTARISEVDSATGALAKSACDRDVKYLPVIVAPSGLGLNDEFILSLNEALKAAGIDDISSDSCYSEAIKVIGSWKIKYPESYERFTAAIHEKGYTEEKFVAELNRFRPDTYKIFCNIYPELSSGSEFNPILRADAMTAYREINRKLCHDHGYSGIYIVFDEFSKYVEGHKKEGFAGDMEVLQRMCELACSSQDDSQIDITLIAHKNISEYGSHIDKDVRKQFEGVEGRLKERLFVVSGKNNYELIHNAIHKTEEGCEELCKSDFTQYFNGVSDISGNIACFSSLFPDRNDFRRIIAEGCFPLTPVAAYILLNISEKVAQNERTVFTFISHDEFGSLPRIIKERPANSPYYVGSDAVYDYFANLFKESVEQPQIHNEWLKAQYALSRTEDGLEKKIIKALALINMTGNTEELPADEKVIACALGVPEDSVKKAVEALKGRQLILFRSRFQVLAFRNNVGINLDKEIKNAAAALDDRFAIEKEVERSSDLDYVLPRIYNQKNTMTRYFRYIFLTETEFMNLPSADVLLDEEHFADGCIIGIVSETQPDSRKIAAHAKEIADDRMIVIVPDRVFDRCEVLRKAAAVRRLLEDAGFIDQNKVLEQELQLYLDDLVFEINAFLDQQYLPENGRCSVYHKGEKKQGFSSASRFNHFLSDICAEYYKDAPKVNYELVNIRNVSGQYLKARNNVVNAMLAGEDPGKYTEGTSPEAMLYRNTLINTGILQGQKTIDDGSKAVISEIQKFINDSIGSKRSFTELYSRLLGRNYGMRQGIMPLFIVSQLIRLNDMPVIYLGDNEVEVNAEILNNINKEPGKYFLYIEQENGEKEKYLQKLEKMFPLHEANKGAQVRHRRLINIARGMQLWYRSLPQYTQHFMENDGTVTDAEMNGITGLRNILRRQEINPREAVFEKIPCLFDRVPNYPHASSEIAAIRKLLDGRMGEECDKAIKSAKEVFAISGKASLTSGLRDWYRKQSDTSKAYIGNSRCNNLMEYLANLKTSDDEVAVARLSKTILDMYIEDWNDSSLEDFKETLSKTKSEIEEQSVKLSNGTGTNTLQFTGSDGQPIERTYDSRMDSSTGYFLENAIESAIDEFGESLETNQKVAILVQTIEKLIKNK